jgi:hypothetical protein
MNLSEIVQLENALDAALVDWRTVGRFEPGWLAAGIRWSKAVWDFAAIRGGIETGAFAANPVFVCGAHRSGTTFLRDLLDGHPHLAVLPAEAAYFGPLRMRLARLDPHAAARELGELWLRRLANPVNQSPFWLLGRTSPVGSPYVDFARRLIGGLGTRINYDSTQPLVAIARAYAAGRETVYWVEKTPGTERYLSAIWREMPEARIIHIVRDPDAVARSYRMLLRRANGDATSFGRALYHLIGSYRTAAKLARYAPADRYRLLRYEALVADTGTAMRAAADFLGIPMHDCLLHPSVAGLAAESNSSHQGGGMPVRLSAPDRMLLAVARHYFRSIPGG